MSLTRAEWERLWNEVKAIEHAYHSTWPLPHSGHRRRVRTAIIRMKGAIESVIGQTEWDPTALRGKWHNE